MARFALPFFVAASLCVVPTVAAAPPPAPQAVAELAATGTLRAAINFGNPILATRDPATGEARGTSVDLARELGSAARCRGRRDRAAGTMTRRDFMQPTELCR